MHGWACVARKGNTFTNTMVFAFAGACAQQAGLMPMAASYTKPRQNKEVGACQGASPLVSAIARLT